MSGLPCGMVYREIMKITLFLIVLGVAVYSVQAHGQPMPLPNNSAQELLLQQQRERELREQMDNTANVRTLEVEQPGPEQMRIPEHETPCFPIENITLTGELSNQFQFALRAAGKTTGAKDPAIGRCLGSQGINIVMARVQNAIIAKGVHHHTGSCCAAGSDHRHADPHGNSGPYTCHTLGAGLANTHQLAHRPAHARRRCAQFA